MMRRSGCRAVSSALAIFLAFLVFVTSLQAQFPKLSIPTSLPGGKGKGKEIPVIPSIVGCAGGAAGALVIAKFMAQAEGKRLKLNAEQTKQRERSYQLGLAMAGCGGGAALTGTAFAKMSERGKKEREQDLQLAAADATPRTYKDPDNPTLEGRITPQPSYSDSGKECRTVEDNLAEDGKGETAYLKYCKQADGKWAQETSAPAAAGAGN